MLWRVSVRLIGIHSDKWSYNIQKISISFRKNWKIVDLCFALRIIQNSVFSDFGSRELLLIEEDLAKEDNSCWYSRISATVLLVRNFY
jgi:hypothetical protein